MHRCERARERGSGIFADCAVALFPPFLCLVSFFPFILVFYFIIPGELSFAGIRGPFRFHSVSIR